MGLGKRLLLSSVGLLVLAALAGLFGIQQLNSGLSIYAGVVESDLQQVRRVAAANLAFKDQIASWKNTLLRGVDQQERNQHWVQFQRDHAKVRAEITAVRAQIQDEALRATIDRFLKAHEQMGEQFKKGLDSFVASGFDPAAGDAFVKDIDRAPNDMLGKLATDIAARSQEAAELAQAKRARALGVSLAALGLVLVLGVAVAAWITRGVMQQVGGEPDAARAIARRIAEGDLGVDVQIRQGDKLSLLAAMRDMRNGLMQIVSAVRQSSDQLVTGAADIARIGRELSESTDVQSQTLQGTAQAAGELSETITENARHAGEASSLAEAATQVTREGGEIVARVVDTMKGINESSRKIADIIGVIDGIAFQTNILALNAAVEAARAGEQGRGFAVVASEVRTLAQRSASAAREIKDLIDASVTRVDQGSALVDQAGSKMLEIVASIERVGETLHEISAAGERQRTGVGQVDASVAQLGDATRMNAQLAAEGRGAADQLAENSAQLAALVARFRLPGTA